MRKKESEIRNQESGKRLISYLIIIAVFIFVPLRVIDAADITETNRLKDISLITDISVERDGDLIDVMVDSKKPLRYAPFFLYDPLRLIIDISDAAVGTDQKRIEVNSGFIKDIQIKENFSSVQFVRLEIKLFAPVEYNIDTKKSGFIIKLAMPESSESENGHIISTLPSSKSPPIIYDLKTCIKYALDNHPLLREMRAGVMASETSVILSKKESFSPKLDLRSRITDLLTGEKRLLTSGSGEEIGIISNDPVNRYYSTAISIDQPLISNGTTIFKVSPSEQKAIADLHTEEEIYAITKDDIIFQVSKAYFTVIKDMEEVKVEEGKVKTLKSIYKAALAKYNSRLISKNDLLLVKVERVKGETNLIAAANSLSLSISELANKMGMDPRKEIKVAGYTETSQPLPDLDRLINSAYRHNPELNLYRHRIDSAKATVKLVRAETSPTLKLNSNVTIIDDFDLAFDTNWRVSLLMKIPLFDSGINDVKVAKASYMVKRKEMSILQTRHTITMNIIQTYIENNNANAMITLAKKEIEQAEESLRLARERYMQDITTLSSVFEAQDRLSIAKKNLLESELKKRIAYAFLKKITGGELGEE